MKRKIITALVTAQLALVPVFAWADNGNDDARPHIMDSPDDHSPGVTLAIFVTLLLIGFGVGYIVGRKTRKNK